MPGSHLASILRHLRRVGGFRRNHELLDAGLLERWVAHRDEAAFEVLVWRHGPMVLGVCRRVVGGEHEAEDAFQATFLALVRRAGAIGKREAVGSWLYKVAYRIALKARERVAKQRTGDRRAHCLMANRCDEDLLWRDVRPVLDEELQRLPERYRVPFVLCYLDGKTNEEAARELGCPTGTIVSRLARARERLRRRLIQRGVTLSAGLLTAGLAQQTTAIALPPALVGITIKTAVLGAVGKAVPAGVVSTQVAALTEGVLRAMWMTKVKVVAALLLMGMVLSAGILAYPRAAAEGTDPVRPAERSALAVEEAKANARGPQPAGLVFVDVAGKGEEGEPGAPDRKPEPFARRQLQEAEKELLQVHAELRRKQVELAVLRRKEKALATEPLPASRVDKQVGGDARVIELAFRVSDLEHTLEKIKETAAAPEQSPAVEETRKQLAAARKALAQRREELIPSVQAQLRRKAREELQVEVDQLQERVAFLKELEKVLTDEVKSLSLETRSGISSTEERLRALENEIRQLKSALAEMRKAK